jgi:hypothetical protein
VTWLSSQLGVISLAQILWARNARPKTNRVKHEADSSGGMPPSGAKCAELSSTAMKRFAFYLCYYLVGTLLIVWPLGLFGSIFLFDAPFRGSGDAASRFATLGAILIFPLLYRSAWKRGKAALQGDDSLSAILLPLLGPLLSPAWIVFDFAYVAPRVLG